MRRCSTSGSAATRRHSGSTRPPPPIEVSDSRLAGAPAGLGGARMIDFNFVQRNLPVFMEGLQTTLVLSLLAFLLALAWGLLVVAARLSRLGSLRFLALAFVELMRNTPVLVQMYFIFFGSAVLGYPLTGFVAGLIALTLQNGAYLSEVYRGGIEAVSRRQAEAGLALGMLERQ